MLVCLQSKFAAVDVQAAAAGAAVSSLEEARSAVVQIEAVGTFVDPEQGWRVNAAGRGSGFIIDPAGIAITNNHVVTGAAYLKVQVAGERKERNARVLGVSECAALAVIDIEGGNYPYLEWFEGQIKVGLDVYAAGFPLGDPEFTLTRGIIAKARTNGNTGWSAVPHVVQHDASINPGNSGGPLIDQNGRVVGVNLATAPEIRQYFAIAKETALPVIETLRTGVDLDSIGINGQAITDGESFGGIWVASVQSGSPADRVGIKAGDVILTMEGITLGMDGTMATYCDILRSHDATDVLKVQVLRMSTEEVLEGQLNGRPLARSFSVAQRNNQGTTSNNYTRVTDRGQRIAVDVPAHWTDVRDGDWVINGETVGVRLAASPDVQALLAGWNTPGLLLSASATLAAVYEPQAVLDAVDYSDTCRYAGRTALKPGKHRGFFDHWQECGQGNSSAIIMAVVPERGNYLAVIELYAVTDADLAAQERILESLTVQELGGTQSNSRNRRGR
jgi:serine protease Do